jgi:hypothetical protein
MSSNSDEISTAQSNIADSFEKIQLGLKLVPNMDQHAFLLKRMTLAGGSETEGTGLEDYVTYNNEALGDQSTFPHFFEWNGA